MLLIYFVHVKGANDWRCSHSETSSWNNKLCKLKMQSFLIFFILLLCWAWSLLDSLFLISAFQSFTICIPLIHCIGIINTTLFATEGLFRSLILFNYLLLQQETWRIIQILLRKKMFKWAIFCRLYSSYIYGSDVWFSVQMFDKIRKKEKMVDNFYI